MSVTCQTKKPDVQGGVIYIGKDDNGDIVGLEEYKRLMDDIPNKTRNAMGITVEVNLHEEKVIFKIVPATEEKKSKQGF